jgi:CDP-glycerol glycerophosphotransferase
MYKSKKQVYVQTWHGDRGFKKVLRDSSFNSQDTYIESKICDLAISGSDYGDRVYRSAFEYNGQILKVGSPRNDILINGDGAKLEKIKRDFGIDGKTKILLYAPTLRRQAANQNELQSAGEIDLQVVINTLQEKTKEEWCCLVRAHSAVKGLAGIATSNKIHDVTSYEDMSDLLLVSDFLITDYSSSAGDFALLNKPIVLFQADRDQYLIYDRAFYFDIDKSPYMVVRSQEELEQLIEKLDWSSVQKNCKDILNFYGTYETGEASQKVLDYILNNLKLSQNATKSNATELERSKYA